MKTFEDYEALRVLLNMSPSGFARIILTEQEFAAYRWTGTGRARPFDLPVEKFQRQRYDDAIAIAVGRKT